MATRVMRDTPVAEVEQQSIGELVRQLVEDSGHLVQTELQLAKSELADNLKSAAIGAVVLVLGGTFLMASLFVLVIAAIDWLTPKVGLLYADLIVAGATLAIGVTLVLIGKKRLESGQLAPRRAVATAERLVEDAKQSLKEPNP